VNNRGFHRETASGSACGFRSDITGRRIISGKKGVTRSPTSSIFTRSSTPRKKRRGVEALGVELIGKLSYYGRWIVAFANILFEKSILTPDQ